MELKIIQIYNHIFLDQNSNNSIINYQIYSLLLSYFYLITIISY